MTHRVKRFILFVATLHIVVLFLSGQVGGNAPLGAHNGVNTADCLNCHEGGMPFRTVMQIIDNTFYKWHEYRIDEEGGLCIYLVAPESRPLSAEESRALLTSSRGWLEQFSTAEKVTKGVHHTVVDTLPDLPDLMPVAELPRPPFLHKAISHEADTAITRSQFFRGSQAGENSCPGEATGKSSSSGNDSSISLLHVIDSDTRERVTEAACRNYPLNTVGYIVSDYGTASFRGSGFLVGPHTVLTNAHNLYSSEYGGWYKQVSFFPGQFQAYKDGPITRPYGQREAIDGAVPNLYRENEDQLFLSNAYDYGALFIEIPFEGITTFMPLEFDYSPNTISIAGYPSEVHEELQSNAMWLSSGPVINIEDRELDYLADVTRGTSGGPVFVRNDATGDGRIVGLVAQGRVSYNTGPRLTYHNKALIEAWMQWMPDPESYNITLTANPATGGTVTGQGVYDHGESVFLTASAKKGYRFKNWTEKGQEVSTQNIYTFTAAADRHLTANFEEVEENDDIALKAGMDTGRIGDNVSVKITISNAAGIWGGQFDLSFDPSILKPVSVSGGDYIPEEQGDPVLSGNFMEANLHYAPGMIRILWVTADGSTAASGVVCTVVFEILEEGESVINFNDLMIEAPTERAVTAPSPGRITALPAFTPGDVNDDGVINVLDVALVMRHVLEIALLSAEKQIVADVNQDGLINVIDVSLIMRKAIGLIDDFPKG